MRTPVDTIELRSCLTCQNGLHEQCFAPVDSDSGRSMCCCSLAPVESIDVERNPVGRPLSNPEDITDPRSTGRKRAKALYPIFPGMTCEWAGLKYAGGGIEPIVGCAGNTIEEVKTGPTRGDRHHGPDKNTLNNGLGNVHRICTYCHNRWHAANDKYYPGKRPPASDPWLPIDPEGGPVKEHDRLTKATEEEIEASDQYWSQKKL